MPAINVPDAISATNRAFMAAFEQGAMDRGVSRVQLETVEFSQLGEVAVEVGRYTVSARDMPVLEAGKYVVVWKREGDAWRWHRDIWNSSRPPST